jgi:predicted O-methyltransferase YrrM
MIQNNYRDIDFSNIEDFETACLDKIDSKIEAGSMMSRNERCFLNGIIRKIKPCRVLEIGVASGGFLLCNTQCHGK